ncbi:squalene/phytoene synthase family protein [Primorskyibacter sp. S187A]|uniref:squalene/phytoene synthase family protein n=1 Tax=Primorskyibacter sp. S187A TaxID=3415130 RepID=UPI003C7AB2AF
MADRPAWHACAEIVEKGDPDRFAAAMLAPVSARAVLFPLYALNVEVARAPWVTQEAMIAEMRLQWWHDALGEIAGDGDVRRHEVTTPLATVISPAQARLLQEAVEARRWDIYRDPFEDAAAFESYIRQTSGHVMSVAVESLGGAVTDNVQQLAYAAGLASYFRAVPELEARGRRPLVDGRPEAVVALAKDALGQLDAVRLRDVAPAARPALYPAALARPILKAVCRDPSMLKDTTLVLAPIKRSVRFIAARLGKY